MAASPDYAGYADQLARLPGGPSAAVTDFLGPWLAGPDPRAAAGAACWSLHEGGRLSLRPAPDIPGLVLVHENGAGAVEIARFDGRLMAAAQETAISPLVLALLAIAAGDVDDGRRLKRRLPGLDGAAKDLMLMTLCRLCG